MHELLRKAKAAKARGENGFTLIELLVVILVIGILAAIVVVALGGTSADAKSKACTQDTANLYSAFTNYQNGAGAGTVLASTGSTTTGIIPNTTSNATWTYAPYSPTDLAALSPTYITKVPPASVVTAYLVSAGSGVTNSLVVVAGTSDPKCTPAGI